MATRVDYTRVPREYNYKDPVDEEASDREMPELEEDFGEEMVELKVLDFPLEISDGDFAQTRKYFSQDRSYT